MKTNRNHKRKDNLKRKQNLRVKAHLDPSYRMTVDSLEKELMAAKQEAIQNKRGTTNAIRFELFQHDNIRKLAWLIMNDMYEPHGGIAFINFRPTTREIFGADFADRVVHHYLFDKFYDFIDRRLDPDAYSCRIGYGTDYGIKRLQRYMNLAMQDPGAVNPETGEREAYVFKFDLSGYFMHIDRQKLYTLMLDWLKKQYPAQEENGIFHRSQEYYVVKRLWKKVIMDEPTDKAHRRGRRDLWLKLPSSKSLYKQAEGTGIVIGNLSSQLLSNVFLDQLDRFMRKQLGFKRYGRYVDDFYIVVTRAELGKAYNAIRRVHDYLDIMGLELNTAKTRRYNVKQGVPFLGAVVYLQHLQVSRRVRKNYYKAVRSYLSGKEEALDSLASYRGQMAGKCSKKVMKKIWKKAERDIEKHDGGLYKMRAGETPE